MRLTLRPRPRPAGRRARTGYLVVLALVMVLGCSSTGAPSAPPPGTAAKRYKVTIAGDSISLGLGASMRSAVDADWEVKVIGEGGTGLARPDRFDWPERLRQLARDFPPTVLVLSLSSNDAQDLTDAKGTVVVAFAKTAAWDAEYSRRLAAAFDAFASSPTRVIWVGHVVTTEARVATTNRHIHQLATAVAGTRPFVQVSDLAALLGTGEQKADRCLLPDGLHLTVACLDEAATKLQPELRSR